MIAVVIVLAVSHYSYTIHHDTITKLHQKNHQKEQKTMNELIFTRQTLEKVEREVVQKNKDIIAVERNAITKARQDANEIKIKLANSNDMEKAKIADNLSTYLLEKELAKANAAEKTVGEANMKLQAELKVAQKAAQDAEKELARERSAAVKKSSEKKKGETGKEEKGAASSVKTEIYDDPHMPSIALDKSGPHYHLVAAVLSSRKHKDRRDHIRKTPLMLFLALTTPVPILTPILRPSLITGIHGQKKQNPKTPLFYSWLVHTDALLRSKISGTATSPILSSYRTPWMRIISS